MYIPGGVILFREAIGKAETILLAQEEACQKLGVETHEAEFEILQMPAKKTLGIFGGKLAEVRAFIKSDPSVLAENYIRAILDGLEIKDYELEKDEKDNGVEFKIDGDSVGNIIGHRGETLDAVQYLAGLVANNSEGSYYRVSINVGNYREKREKTLDALGMRVAKKSLRYKRNFSLEPMNPYERRIIHTAVQKIKGVTSWSEGEGTSRHVVIGLKKDDNSTSKNETNKYVDLNRRSDNQNGEIKGAPLYGKIK